MKPKPVIRLKTYGDELNREEPKKEEPKKEEPKKEEPKKEEPEQDDPRIKRDLRQSIILKNDAFKIGEDEEDAKEEPKKEEPKEDAIVLHTVKPKRGPKLGNAGMLSLFIQNMYLGKASPHRLDPDAEDKVLVKTLNVYLKKLDRAEKAKDGKAEKDDPLANLKIFLATKELKNGKEHALTNFRRMYDVLEDKEKERFIKYLRGVNEDFDLGIDIQGLIDGKARVKPKSRKEAVKNPAHEEKEVFMIEHEPEPPARSHEE